MMFNGRKLREIRKKKYISVNYITEQLGVSRGTLWTWESGTRIPNEKATRKLAEILNISVSFFSDLQESVQVSNLSLKEIVNSSLKNNEHNEALSLTDNLIGVLLKLRKKEEQNAVLLNALLNSTDMMFYIKDTNLRFIKLNEPFLKTLSAPSDISYAGKGDELFFSHTEAQENTREDEKTLILGNPVINREGIIPGTRKKKYALISKYPILDTNKNITGIIGVFIDITEQRRNRENSELLKIILDNVASTSITIRNLKTAKYLYMNKAKELIYERKINDFFEKGKTFWFNQCIHPDDRKRIKSLVEKAENKREKQELNQFQFKIITPKGKEKKISCKTAYIKYNEMDCSLHIESEMD